MKTVVIHRVDRNSNYAIFPVKQDGKVIAVIVHFNRGGKTHQGYFALGKRSYKEADAEARKWRDAELEKHPVRISEADFEKLTSTNSSGVRGVRLYRRTTKSPYIGVEVQWPALGSKREEKKKLMFEAYDSREDCIRAGATLRKKKIREYLEALEAMQSQHK